MKIPARFNRVAAAFDEAVMKAAEVRLCASSGSEHSPAADLSDLVNSFLEKEYNKIGNGKEEEKETELDDSDCSESETIDMLEDLLRNNSSGEDGRVKQRIYQATEIADRRITDGWKTPTDFKRRIMSSLRDAGFEAGLCKSRWEKTGRHPAGTYEYIDVIVNKSRYIVEVNLATEFEIARPTSNYISLLEVFPRIFVGKAEELKQIVRLMCNASRISLKRAEMSIPPWRRNGYMQSKWFATYKRTTNEVSDVSKLSAIPEAFSSGKRSVGFEAVNFSYCRDDFGRRGGLKVGLLSAALNGS